VSLPSIEVTIDEVVLRGVAAGQQYDFADALHETLSSLIEASIEQSGNWRSRSESSRRVPSVAIGEKASSQLGDAVAHSVYDALSEGGAS